MATSGVVHLLQPSGGFFCIEIALPPSEENGIKRYDDLYQWVHEQVLAEKVDSSQAMQDPFLVCTTARSHSHARMQYSTEGGGREI